MCGGRAAKSLSLSRRPGSRVKSIVSLAHVQIRDVRVNLSRGNIAMAQERLDRTRVGAVLHQVCPKAVPQRVRRNVGYACRRRVGLDYSPGIVPRHRTTAVQKQLGLTFVAELFSNRQVSLQPVNRALAQRDAPLFVAFAVAGNQSRVQINVTDL